MNKEEAQNILSKVKVRKLGFGDDLGIATRGAEAISIMMFQILLLLFILSNISSVRENVLFVVIIGTVFPTALAVLVIFYRKVARVRDWMLSKKIFYLNDI